MGCRLYAERALAERESWERQQYVECQHERQREQQQREQQQSFRPGLCHCKEIWLVHSTSFLRGRHKEPSSQSFQKRKDEQYCNDAKYPTDSGVELDTLRKLVMPDVATSDAEIIESVIGFEALYESMYKCKKNVLWKNSTAYFFLHGIEQTLKLERELKTGTYVAKEPKCFTLTHPKRREAVSIAFRDRVYQRSLNDNILYPRMTASFIDANMACQKDKGTDLARDTLDRFLREAFRKHGNGFHVLQGDIHGYYQNMSHERTEAKFKARIPKPAFEMTKGVLNHQYKGERGYNPGSQMIQIAGISYLDRFDHFVKEVLHIRWYLRYMDDFVLLHEDSAYLEYCRKRIEEFLESEECELHPRKTRLYRAKEGIPFLGFVHRITGTGKIIRLIDPANVKAERKKLRREVGLVRKGRMTKQKVDQGFECWKAHASKGNTEKVIEKMNTYYKSLWEEFYHEQISRNQKERHAT